MPRKLDFGADEETMDRPPLPLKATPRDPIDPALASAAAARARAAGFVPRDGAAGEDRSEAPHSLREGVPASRPPGPEPSGPARQFVGAPTMVAAPGPMDGDPAAHSPHVAAVPGHSRPIPAARTGMAPTVCAVPVPTSTPLGAGTGPAGNDVHTLRRRPGRPRREPQTRVSLAGPIRVIERFQAFCLANGDATYWQGIEMLLDEIENR